LIPLQKYPGQNYPYFVYDSFGQYQPIPQYPVLPPLFVPQQDHRQLPPIEQPMFQVGRKMKHRDVEVDDAPQVAAAEPKPEVALPTLQTSDVFKNYANKNSDIPDVQPPPLPVSSGKQN